MVDKFNMVGWKDVLRDLDAEVKKIAIENPSMYESEVLCIHGQTLPTQN